MYVKSRTTRFAQLAVEILNRNALDIVGLTSNGKLGFRSAKVYNPNGVWLKWRETASKVEFHEGQKFKTLGATRGLPDRLLQDLN